MTALPESMVDRLREKCGDALLVDVRRGKALLSDFAQLEAVMRKLGDMGFARLVDFTALHHEANSFTMMLLLRAPEHGHSALQLKWKYDVDAHGAHPTLSRIWKAALTAEREIFDMFGIGFAGHEKLDPLLLPEQFQGFPLRKDFAMPQRRSDAAGIIEKRLSEADIKRLKEAGR